MKQFLIGAVLLPAVTWAGVITAPVTKVVPQYREVIVTRSVCVNETQTPQSGNPITGAIIGGVIGSQVAKGGDRTLGAGVGAIAGAVIGDQVGRQPVQVQRCTPEAVTEQRSDGFMVHYRIGETEFRQHMDRDPGQWVSVTVTAR